LTLWWDAHVAVPTVAMLGHVNDYGEAERRTYYGQAGSHRIKEYGVEYRVLSGAIMLSPFLLGWAMGAIRQATTLSNTIRSLVEIKWDGNDETFEAVLSADQVHTKVGEWFENTRLNLDGVRDIIDNHDVEGAREYVENNLEVENVYLPNLVWTMVDADKVGVGLPTNIADAWAMNQNIENHVYIGCEKLMKGGSAFPVFKNQFPAKELRQLTKSGWR